MERDDALHVGEPVEVAFAANRGVRYEPGHVREIRRHHFGVIRTVVVTLKSGRLCVCTPSSLRHVVRERA